MREQAGASPTDAIARQRLDNQFIGRPWALTAPRVHLRMAPYHRRLELYARTLTRATGLIERALGDRGALTRAELGQLLHRPRIAITTVRMAHIAIHAELEGIVCSGPRRERQLRAIPMKRALPPTPRGPRTWVAIDVTGLPADPAQESCSVRTE